MKDKAFILVVILLIAVLLSIVFISPPSSGRKKPITKATPKRIAKVETPLPPGEVSKEQLQEEIQQTKAMMSALVEMNATLKNNNASLEENISRLEEALGKTKEENLSLKSALEETASKKEALLKEMSSLKVVVDELRQTTEPIKMRLKEITAGLGELKGVASKDLKKQLRSLDGRLASIDEDIERFIKENNAYRISAQNLQGLLCDKNNELEALKKQAAQEGSEKERLKSESRLLSKELDQIRKTRSIFEDTIDELNKKNTSLSEEVTRLNALLNERESAVKQAQEAIKQRDEAIKARIDLQASLSLLNSKNQQLEQDLSVARAQLEAINKEYADFKIQFNAYKESSLSNEGELAKRAEEILRLRDKLIVSEAKMDELKTALKTQEKETTSLRERFVAIQLENENLRDELSQTKSKLNDLKLQLSQILEMNSSLQGRLQEIGSMFKGPKPSAEPQREEQVPQQPKEETSQPQGKRVDVELMPQQ